MDEPIAGAAVPGAAKAARRTALSRVRWIVLAGLAVAAVRFALDFRRVDDPILFEWGDLRVQGQIGNYYVVPLLFAVGAFAGTFRGLSWGRLLAACAWVSLFCFAVPNTVAYTTAQFLGWTHGRFAPAPVPPEQRDAYEAWGEEGEPYRAPPIPKSAVAKVINGLSVGVLTGLVSFVWNAVWIHLLVVLPRLLRSFLFRKVSPT